MIHTHKDRGLLIRLIMSVSLLTASNICAEESVPISDQITEETEGFLSDPARAGSLVGTIVAGASIANPLAPILGSLAGFFIGKETDYSKIKESPRQSFANRSLIPDNNVQIATLSGLTDNASPSTSEQDVLQLGLISQPIVEQQPPSSDSPITININKGLETETPSVETTTDQKPAVQQDRKNKTPQQLAFACSNVDTSKPLPIFCYYFSQ